MGYKLDLVDSYVILNFVEMSVSFADPAEIIEININLTLTARGSNLDVRMWRL